MKETDEPNALEHIEDSESNSTSLQSSDGKKDSSSGNIGMVNAMRSPMNMGFGSSMMGNQGYGMGGISQQRPGSFYGQG